MEEYKIYTLTDPFTNEIFYVGITKRALSRRHDEHLYWAKKSSPKLLKCREIILKGREPIISIVDFAFTKREAFIKEVEWIKKLESLNAPLLNIYKQVREIELTGVEKPIESIFDVIEKWKLNKNYLAKRLNMPLGTFKNKLNKNQSQYRFSNIEIGKLTTVLDELQTQISNL